MLSTATTGRGRVAGVRQEAQDKRGPAVAEAWRGVAQRGAGPGLTAGLRGCWGLCAEATGPSTSGPWRKDTAQGPGA